MIRVHDLGQMRERRVVREAPGDRVELGEVNHGPDGAGTGVVRRSNLVPFVPAAAVRVGFHIQEDVTVARFAAGYA